MKVNQATINRIKQSEGLRLEAYPDPGSKDGKPVTIGYGTTRINGKPISLGTKITKEQAEQYLKADIEKFADGIAKLIKVKLNNNQFGALVSFAYNIGLEAFKNSTLLRILNAGDFNGVPAQMRRWNKNDGKVMQGLINRREDEIKLWLTPDSGMPLETSTEPTETVKPVRPMGGMLAFLLALIGFAIAFFFGGAD